jgi:hypothetical protein
VSSSGSGIIGINWIDFPFVSVACLIRWKLMEQNADVINEQGLAAFICHHNDSSSYFDPTKGLNKFWAVIVNEIEN